MDFARSILEKYGWKEGMGLGAKENGIVNALRPSIKLDLKGVGYSGESAQFTSQWWEHAYNHVANTIEVSIAEGGVTMKKHSNKPKHKRALPPVRTYETMSYNSFVKTSLLENGATVSVKVQNDSIDDVSKDANETSTLPFLSDEDIFRACGNRTVHKGARHGLKLSGKLARLAKQEKEMLDKLQEASGEQAQGKKLEALEGKMHNITASGAHGSTTVKKEGKRKKKRISSDINDAANNLLDLEPDLDCIEVKKKHKYSISVEMEENVGPILDNETKMLKRKKDVLNEESPEVKKILKKSLKYCSEPVGEKNNSSFHKFNEDRIKEYSVLCKKQGKGRKTKLLCNEVNIGEIC